MLINAGWRVEIINPDFEGSDESGIRFRRIMLPSRRLGRMWQARKAALSAIQKSRADICTLHDPELLPLLLELKHVPIQTTYDAHEDLPAQMCNKPWLPPGFRILGAKASSAMLNRYLPYADGVIAATDGIADKLSPLNERLCVFRNRPTEQDFNLFDIARSCTKRMPKAICYAGAISEKRGLFRMIACCFQAGATLMLAGRFESDALKKKAEGMSEYACVKYLGVLDRSEIATLYAQCSAGLVLLDETPAYRDSEPIKLFEYLCAGLPVVASDFAHWRTLCSEDSVKFVNIQSEQEITQAIRNMISAPFEVDIEAARQQFGNSEDASRLLQFYAQLEEKGRPKP